MSTQNSKHNYNDVKLFLVLIPLINVLNYYLTYPDAKLNWFLVLTFTIDTLEGYAAWWVIRTIVQYLDKRIPFFTAPMERIIFQLAATTIAGVAVIALLTELVNWLATDTPVPLDFYTKTIFLFVIWIFVVNGIYVALHFYEQWQLAEEKRKEALKLEQKGFTVKHGKQDLLLQFEEIAGIFVDGEYAVICNTQNKKFFTEQSLDKLEKQMPVRFFFRLNRQYIVHRNFIIGFERADNSKINVLLQSHDNLPSSVTVSRIKAPSFKEWFEVA